MGTVANVLLVVAILIHVTRPPTSMRFRQDVQGCLSKGATMQRTSLDGLWNAASSPSRTFRPDQLQGYPEATRRYLGHAIAPGSPLASVVRLRMHGEIKLRRWCPFTAEQVISWDRGFIWSATARIHGFPVRGFDRLVDGHGMVRWKLLGIVPVIAASGLDVTRSAAGRVMAESVWLPSVLCRDGLTWTARDVLHPQVHLTIGPEAADLRLCIDADGVLQSVSLSRWSNPDNTRYRYENFGGLVEQEHRFAGFTVPTRLRVGYFASTNRFESDGEFFRATIDDAAYR